MPDYTLSAKITGDSSGFEKAIQNAEKSASNFEKQMKSISKKAKRIGDKISGIGTKLTVGVTTPLALASKSMVDAASDFDENLNKIDVAFGNSASEVKAWADTATESFGLSMNQALEATSLFGDMATSMGISQSEAASMSTALAGLAGDMASFKNIDIDQAMTALNGVFTGETESLKQLGIVMTEVNLQEFANGLGLVYDDMTQAEKVQLRYNYVMEMSKNAIGDYARTSDGTANSMRTFQASVENLAVTLGENLLPIVTPIIQKATEMVNAFAEADPELQQLVLKIAGIAAAAGPALIVLGKLVSSFGAVTGVIGPAIGRMVALGGVSKTFSAVMETADGAIVTCTSKISALGGAGKTLSSVFSAITSPIGIAVAAITALVAAFAYLMTTNEEFRTSVMNTLSVIGESLMPILQTIGQLLTSIGSILVNVLAGALTQLAPILVQMVTFIGSLVQIVAPLVNMLIQSLVPVITQIITSVSNIVNSIIPPLIDILSAVMDAIESILPPIQSVLEAAIEAISSIINAIGPIVGIVGECVSGIMVIVSPIVSFIGDIISGIMSVVNPIVNFFSEIFGSIFSTVSDIFNNIYSVVSGVFTGIQNSWSGLTSFVGGVVDGISGAFNTLVSTVKSVINGVIKGINGAIGVINLIPGVNIGKISYLLHGTDDWQGGFAYMNEGGRGELTYLPNGAQVIPHDISVQYAKEAARANRGVESIDLTGVLEGVTIQVYSQTNVDGTPLKEMAADYTIQKIGREQRAFNRSRGISYA